MPAVEKQSGPDWDVVYMDTHDGRRECMTVFGQLTPEEAIAEARWSLNASCEKDEEKDEFEILAIIRRDGGVDFTISS